MGGRALEGQVALVCGGGGEIGAAIAHRFAQEGAAIALADLRRESAAAIVADIRGRGGVACEIACDISHADEVEAAVAEAVRRFGKLTILANVAAAVTPAGTVETLTLQDWNRALDVNLTGAFLACKYAIPEMRKAGGGSIVSIASSHAHIGVPRRAPYCTSKAALVQLMKCVAIDHAADRIRANTISPGAIDTARSSLGRYPTREAANRAKGPYYLMERTGRPEEIAAGALFLVSDESSFMTGADLLIDGGFLAFKGKVNESA